MLNLRQIALEMEAHYPSKKTNHYQIASKYLKACQDALTKGILLATELQIQDEMIPVSWDQLRKSCGTYGPKKQQAKWFDWLHTHHPILIKVKSGYNFGKQGTLTMVKTTREIDRILAEQNPQDTFNAFYPDGIPAEVDTVRIDLKSLNAYMQANRSVVAQREDHKKKIDHNFKDASIIFDIASYCGGKLPQVIKMSEFGRKYYTGPNLQSVSKIVRLAALGDCHSYDIEASVFTWKFDLAKDLMPEVKLPATLTYLDYKDHHRKRLAELVFGNKSDYSVATIKQAITAIGFGARATNAVWMLDGGQWKTTALREIIKSQEYLEKFLTDKELIAEFILEQEAINHLIFDTVKHDPMIKNKDILKTAGGKLSRNKTISYLYQQTESTIIKRLLKIAEPAEVMLLCHDGFYTKRKANKAELSSALKEFLPNGQLDHEEHTAYKFIDDSDQVRHRQLIQEQEQQLRLAKGSLTKDHYDSSPRQEPERYYEDYSNGYCDEVTTMSSYDPENDPWLDELEAGDRQAYLLQRKRALAQLEFNKVFK